MSAASEITVRLPRLHAGQLRVREAIAAASARFAVIMCGRRWGKTTDGVEWIGDGAVSGEPCAWMAPTYKFLGEAWRELTERLRPAALQVSEQDHRITLYGGGSIECWTLDTPDPGRGRKYARVVVDEAGLVRGLLETWNAAIRPTLVDLGGHARIYGTPKGRTHGFVQLFRKGEASDPGWASFRAPTVDNPHIPIEEIEVACRDLPPAVFAQEFEGIPADDGANPFGIDAIARCTVPKLSTNAPAVWGWDFARAQDWTVGVALDVHGHTCRLERWQGVPWEETARRVVTLTGRAPSVGDSTGVGDPVVEMIQRRGCSMWGHPFTPKSKQSLMQRLATAFQTNQIAIPRGWLVSELEAFEYEYSASGVKYQAPPGLHDDGVMALALAVFGFDRIGVRPPDPAPPQPGPGQDPHLTWRTIDGQPPRWVGPEGDQQPDNGFASQFPVNI